MPGVHQVVLSSQNTQSERTGAGGRIICPRIFGRDLTNIIDQPRAPVRQNQTRSTQQTDGVINTNLHLITERMTTALQISPPPEQTRPAQRTDEVINTDLHLITERVTTALERSSSPEDMKRTINEGVRAFLVEQRRIMAQLEEDE